VVAAAGNALAQVAVAVGVDEARAVRVAAPDIGAVLVTVSVVFDDW